MIYCYLVYEKGLTRSDVIKFMQEIHDNSRVYAVRLKKWKFEIKKELKFTTLLKKWNCVVAVDDE